MLAAQRTIDPELTVRPPTGKPYAIVVGYGRVGKVVCSLLGQHGIEYIAESAINKANEEFDIKEPQKQRRLVAQLHR